MKNPLVSIVICCHNRGHLLPQTMSSVFAQEYDPVEIVVVDDGSTDNTPELMASYGQKIRYYWQENQGVAITRTNACRLAKGEFIAFQDDDDLMPPDRIIRLYEALCRYPSAMLAVGDWEEIDGEGELIGRRTRFNVHVNNEEAVLIKDGYRAILWPTLTPTPHTTLFRRIDGERIGWFDTRFFHACEDTDFFARCAQLGPIVYVPKVVSFYRRQQGSLSGNKILLLYSWFLLFEKHLLSIKAEEKDLRKQIQFRILQTLKQLAIHDSKGSELPSSVTRDYLNKSVSLLGMRNYLEYIWFAQIKLPLRKMILGRV